jgi:tripartite-type tricarboxylate transporter receptor subunit TctC
MAFDALGTSAVQISEGRLRGLAIAAANRWPSLPDVPTAAEAGLPGYEVSTWYALWAPKSTPADIVARMTKELQTALQAPAIKEAWPRNGSDIPNLTGDELGKFVKSEVERWAKVVKDAGVQVE